MSQETEIEQPIQTGLEEPDADANEPLTWKSIVVSWWFILLVINTLTGLACFEYVWCKTKHYRNPIPELDALMPAYRRIDAHNWKKWRFYFGVPLLLPRIIWCIFMFICFIILMNILMFGQDKKKPTSGCRRGCIRFWYRFTAHIFMWFPNLCHVNWKTISPEDVDYY